MIVSAVWLDRTEAQIAHFPRTKREDFKPLSVVNHSRPGAHDPKLSERELFQKIAQELMGSSDILILGPGVAKYHFRNYLMEQYPKLARKIGFFQTMDSPSDRHLQAFVERYLWSKSLSASNS